MKWVLFAENNCRPTSKRAKKFRWGIKQGKTTQFKIGNVTCMIPRSKTLCPLKVTGGGAGVVGGTKIMLFRRFHRVWQDNETPYPHHKILLVTCVVFLKKTVYMIYHRSTKVIFYAFYMQGTLNRVTDFNEQNSLFWQYKKCSKICICGNTHKKGMCQNSSPLYEECSNKRTFCF